MRIPSQRSIVQRAEGSSRRPRTQLGEPAASLERLVAGGQPAAGARGEHQRAESFPAPPPAALLALQRLIFPPPPAPQGGSVQRRSLDEDSKENDRPAGVDRHGNDVQLVGFERALFKVIRDSQATYIDTVRKVTAFWRNFLQGYLATYSRQIEQSILEKLRTPELATPEFLGQDLATTDSSILEILKNLPDADLLNRWHELAEGSGLAAGSVDLQMDFLKIMFDVFLDNKKILPRSVELLGLDQKFDPQANRDPRYYKVGAVDNRGRTDTRKLSADKQVPVPFLPIIGATAVDPKNPGVTESTLPPTDPARSAAVARGIDAQTIVDPKVPFVAQGRALGLPEAATISGTAADFSSLARIAGLKPSTDEFQQFAMAIFAYIGLPGHHSFREIAGQLSSEGVVPYNPLPGVGDYAGPLTAPVHTAARQALSAQYPGLLR